MAALPALLALLALLGIAGVLDAASVVLITYRIGGLDVEPLPGRRERLFDTRQARVFGLPNAVLGLAWFLLVVAAALAELPRAWCLPLLVVSAGTVLFSAWLFWVLQRKLRTTCTLCFLGQMLNVLIFAALLAVCVT